VPELEEEQEERMRNQPLQTTGTSAESNGGHTIVKEIAEGIS